MTATYTVRGIPYLCVVGIPTHETEWGPAWDIELGVVEKMFAAALVKLRAPLRGVELRFLRKSLGLSLASLGQELGVSDVTVLNWEKDHEKRLDLTTEVAARALFAERLGVKLDGTLTALRGTAEAPVEVVELLAAS